MERGFRTLLATVEVLQPAFTRPGFRNAWVVFAGWVLTAGTHAVTQALVVTDVARRLHHERFHRFFSRGTWHADAVGRRLFGLLVARLGPTGRLCLALDDTLTPKKGAAVFGLGCHLDAVRSTKRCRVFSFGHVWVIVALVVRVPFAARRWAFPVLFRLYRTKRECQRTGARYRKKTELGRELVDLVAGYAAAELANQIRDVRKESKGWLVRAPAPCQRCSDTWAPTTTAYWGQRLCADCAKECADWYDDHGNWPAKPGDDHLEQASKGLEARLNAAKDHAGLPPGWRWPLDVPRFKDGGPATWEQVKAVEAATILFEAFAQMEFEAALPDDPFAGPPVPFGMTHKQRTKR